MEQSSERKSVMKYIFKGLEIEVSGNWSFWPIGEDYKERLHGFILLSKKEQEKCRV